MHEITLNLPLPAGKGDGGMGEKRKLKAEFAGDKEGKPPAGYLQGKFSLCRRRFSAGVPGAKPPAKTTKKSPPSPPGKGAGGMGGRKAN